MTSRGLFYLKFWLLLMSVLLSSCDRPYQDRLKVGANHWVGYFPLYLAESEGLLAKSNTQLLEYSSSVDVIRALKNRVINAAALTLDEAISLADTGYPLRIILVADISDGADIIVARQSIKTVAELKGKRVGVENTAVGGFMLSRALSLNGLLSTDITVVPTSIDNHIQHLRQGDIDAVVTFASELRHLQGYPVTKIFDSSAIPNEIVDVLVVNAEWQDEAQLVALAKSWFKSWHSWQEGKVNRELLAQQLGLSESELLEVLSTLKMGDIQVNQSFLSQSPPSLYLIMQRLQDLMLEEHLLSSKLSANAAFIIDPSIYKKASQ